MRIDGDTEIGIRE